MYQLHILIFSVINSIYIILYQIHRLTLNIDCFPIVLIKSYSSMPLLSTALCTCIIIFLIIRGDPCLITQNMKINIGMSMFIWFLPAIRIVFIVYLKLKESLDFYHDECLITNDIYIITYYAHIVGHYFLIFIICTIIIVKLCKIKSNLMIYSHKPLILKIVMYIITLLLFSIVDILTNITREFTEDPFVRSLFLSAIPLMNLILVYVFNWNQNVQESCCNVFCRKKSKYYFNDNEL